VHDAHIRVLCIHPPGSPDPQTPSRARPHCLASESCPALAELDQRGGVAGQPILVVVSSVSSRLQTGGLYTGNFKETRS
jgi:hypothetical protein